MFIDQVLHLRIKRTSASSRRCAFPVCTATRALKNLLETDRRYIASVCKIYIPPISRVCMTHASKFAWHNTDFVNESNDFSKEYIEDMFRLLTDSSICVKTHLVLSKF